MSDDNRHLEEEAQETRVRELLGTLREDIRAPAGLRQAVMRKIGRPRPSLAARVGGWLFRPRLVPLSPAVGGLAVAAVAALVIALPMSSPVATSDGETAQGPTRVVTRFVLVAPAASSVQLTGDFMSWNPEGVVLENLRGSGIWTADVALPPGVHQYTFVVNGTDWTPDPAAALQVADGFGQVNSIVIVPEEGSA